MTHWKVVDELYKMAAKEFPDLTDDQHFEIAMRAYRDIEYKVLMGDGTKSPEGIINMEYTYPKSINKE